MSRKISIVQDPYLRTLFYGKPGSHKTRTAGTACLDDRTYPTLWLDMSGNPMSIRDYERLPDIIEVERLGDINDPYNWIMNGQKPDAKFAKAFDLSPPYKAIVLDQITDLQRISFATVMGQPNLGPGDIGKHAQRRDFYGVLGQMTRFARLYYSLPMHVIMTALEKTTTDEVTGAVTMSPLLWGQSDTEVPGYAYVVARMVHRAKMKGPVLKAIEDSAGEEALHAVALFMPSGKYDAKDQYGALGNYMIDPSIPKMLDLIYGEE